VSERGMDVGCPSTKKGFKSRRKALKGLNEQRLSIAKYGNRGFQGPGAVSVYRCPICEYFHFTSKRYGPRKRGKGAQMHGRVESLVA
jgi:hypothetical protein